MTSTNDIGIAYARQEWDDEAGGPVAICPECEARIPLTKMKDFESFMMDELHDHLTNEHTETDPS